VINENQAIGRAEGKFELLVSLVKENVLSVKNAAEKADMTETEFCRKAGLQIKQ
jgi:hypothetical protein